jgi:glutamine synthetase
MDEGLGEAAQLRQRELAAAGVRNVLLTFVDNSGITRARAVPISRFAGACTSGVGISAAWNAVTATDSVVSSEYIDGPVGDLRLLADPSAACPIAFRHQWAWAPLDQYSQDGTRHPACSRDFARRADRRLRDIGLSAHMSYEVEWYLEGVETGAPAHDGPAVGARALLDVPEFIDDLLACLEVQGTNVEAFNGEFASGQLELCFSPRDPISAADCNVLTRLAIHSVARRHGYRASFSPAFGGAMGNGAHVHLSVWQEGLNLFHGGQGPWGMTGEAEAFMAGMLRELPAMVAIGAPSPASFLRLQPSRYAGAFQCWGRENREAALRFITGMEGTQARSANVEVKCFDQSSNPYLVTGALAAAGLAGIGEKLTLPQEVTLDPGELTQEELGSQGIRRLPTSLNEAVLLLDRSEVLRQALGPHLHGVFLDVRKAEAQIFNDADQEAIVDAYKWRF